MSLISESEERNIQRCIIVQCADAMTHICGVCKRRSYACRSVLGKKYVCPHCYPKLKRLADAEKTDDS